MCSGYIAWNTQAAMLKAIHAQESRSAARVKACHRHW